MRGHVSCWMACLAFVTAADAFAFWLCILLRTPAARHSVAPSSVGMLDVFISAETYATSSNETILGTINHCVLCMVHLPAARAAEV